MAQSVDFLVCARTVRESISALKTFVFFCPFLCNFKPGAKMLLPKRYVTVKFTLNQLEKLEAAKAACLVRAYLA